MFRSISWYATFATSLAGLLPTIKKLESKKDDMSYEEFQAKSYELVQTWTTGRLKAAGVTPEKGNLTINGYENIIKDRAVLFVSNHQGNFDIALLLSQLDVPVGALGKQDLEKIPVVSRMMHNIDCVFVDRHDNKSQLNALKSVVKILKKGHSMIVFPEGTRGGSKELGEFKDGAFVMGCMAKVPIIPITINGTYDMMEKNNNIIKPANISLTIHEPIETKDLSKEEQKQLPKKVFDIINSCLITD